MRGNRGVEAKLTKDELRAIAAYTQDLIDRELCDPGIDIAQDVRVMTLLDVTKSELAAQPQVVDGVVYILMGENLWKHDLAAAWQAKKLTPLDDQSLYAISGVYAQKGQAQIDIVRLRS